MELRDALRLLRSETGLTQAELAMAIDVGYSTESRWENQNTRPNRSSSSAILALARQRCVSSVCLEALTELLLAPRVKDKAEKALMKEVAARMKLEQRELLTSEQFKAVIDNIDLAIIGYRIFSAAPGDTAVFYYNRRYAEIFGCSQEEFEKRSRADMYFGIPEESRREYLRRLALLLGGTTPVTDLSMVLKGFNSKGNVIWLEVKGVSVSRFSFGYELFSSCRDVTPGVEAEQRQATRI